MVYGLHVNPRLIPIDCKFSYFVDCIGEALQPASLPKEHFNRQSEVIYVCLGPAPDKSKSHIDCVSD